MVPFSRNIKGIENASQAFYETYAGVEDVLLEIYSGNVDANHNDPMIGLSDYSYSYTGSSTNIPDFGLGNSEYDNTGAFSIISQARPVSIPIGNNAFGGGTNTFSLTLRVPDIDGDGSPDTLTDRSDVFLWQISSRSDSLTSRDLINIAPSGSTTLNILSQQ